MINSISQIVTAGIVPTREVKRHNYTEDNTKEKTDATESLERIVDVESIFNKKLRFELEEELGIMLVKVIDDETGEVIRQIPTEEQVNISKKTKNLSGLLINKKI